MATEVKKIIVRKGVNSQLPDLDEGEPAFTTDTNQFFVGTSTSSNVELSKVGHIHTISNVTNLQTSLDGKAATSHIHPISDITDLQTNLNGKAATSHVHIISDVTSLQTALDGKVGTSDARLTDARTPIAHTHPISDITDLQTNLNNKVNTNDSRLSDARMPIAHTHNLALDKILLATRTTLGVTSFTVADLDQFQEIEVVYTNETVIDNGNQEFVYINSATVAKCERSLISRTFTDNAPFAGNNTFINSLQLVITGGTNATIGVIQLRQDNEQGTSMSFRTYGTIPTSGNTVKIYGIVMLNN